MKLRLEAEHCQGHNLCNLAAPEIFSISDEDGHAILENETVPGHLEPKARNAVATCPEGALSLET